MVLRLQHAIESSERLIKTQDLGSYPRFSRSGVRPRVYVIASSQIMEKLLVQRPYFEAVDLKQDILLITLIANYILIYSTNIVKHFLHAQDKVLRCKIECQLCLPRGHSQMVSPVCGGVLKLLKH